MSLNNLTQRLVNMNAGRDRGTNLLETAAIDGPFRFAAGSGALVTGSLVVTTGLNSVTAFTCSLNSSGDTATGATDAEQVRVTAITTGAVTVGKLTHSATAAIALATASGTASFYWIAIGR